MSTQHYPFTHRTKHTIETSIIRVEYEIIELIMYSLFSSDLKITKKIINTFIDFDYVQT